MTRPAPAKQAPFKQVDRIGYSLAEAAAKLGVSSRHLRRQSDKGEFPRPVRIGNRSIILAADLEGYIAGLVRNRDKGKP